MLSHKSDVIDGRDVTDMAQEERSQLLCFSQVLFGFGLWFVKLVDEGVDLCCTKLTKPLELNQPEEKLSCPVHKPALEKDFDTIQCKPLDHVLVLRIFRDFIWPPDQLIKTW